jgi:hypothetical protein
MTVRYKQHIFVGALACLFATPLFAQTPRVYERAMSSSPISSRDARAVHITRSTTLPVKYIGAGGPIDPDYDEWVGFDGTRYGHSRFGYVAYLAPTSVGNFELRKNVQNFQAHYSGTWTNGSTNPDVTWNWVAPVGNSRDGWSVEVPSGITREQGKWGVNFSVRNKDEYVPPYAFVDGWANKWWKTVDQKAIATVKYFTRDNGDGAEFEARYHLTLHDEWENIREVLQTPKVRYTKFTSFPITYVISGGAVPTNVLETSASRVDASIILPRFNIGILGGVVEYVSSGMFAAVGSYVGGAPGAAALTFLESAFGNLITDNFLPESQSFYNKFDIWEKSKRAYFHQPLGESSDDSDNFSTFHHVKSDVEPNAITFEDPAMQLQFEATASVPGATPNTDQFWPNCRLTGIGCRQYIEDHTYKGDHWLENGFDGVKTAVISKMYSEDIIGLYTVVTQSYIPPE